MQAVAVKTATGILLAMAIVLVAQLVGSEPVRQKILDNLEVQEGEGVITVRISLTSPVRYIRHFPYESGEELRISIRLFDVSRDNREALFRREALVPFDAAELPLEEVVYEDDFESGGPYLTLLFSRSVDFSVQQGSDSRSVVVFINKPATEIPGRSLQAPEAE